MGKRGEIGMFRDEFNSVCNAAKGKLALLNNNPLGYFMSAMVAGAFITLGGFVTFTLGSILTAGGCTITKVIMAFSFASALSLVVMAGAELFTGNNFVMAAASFKKEVSWLDTLKLWVVCYLGNFVGAMILVALFQLGGCPLGSVGEYFATIAAGKMGGTASALFFKGMLCNMLVCLAVWCCTKMKTESGKLIMIFWCIYIFMACGFEHSIANMSVMAVGLLNGAGVEGVSIAGYFHNLLWVTLGNVAGGALLVAFPYYIIQKEKRQ